MLLRKALHEVRDTNTNMMGKNNFAVDWSHDIGAAETDQKDIYDLARGRNLGLLSHRASASSKPGSESKTWDKPGIGAFDGESIFGLATQEGMDMAILQDARSVDLQHKPHHAAMSPQLGSEEKETTPTKTINLKQVANATRVNTTEATKNTITIHDILDETPAFVNRATTSSREFFSRATAKTASLYSTFAAGASEFVTDATESLGKGSLAWSMMRFFLICCVVFSGFLWYTIQTQRSKSIDGLIQKKYHDNLIMSSFFSFFSLRKSSNFETF